MMHPLKGLRAEERLIVALDVPSDQVGPTVIACRRAGVKRFKVGHRLLKRMGPTVIELVREHGGIVMYDDKMIDIPNTMEEGAASIVSHGGVEMFTVMAGANVDGVAAAVKGAAGKAFVIGVTVLTTMTPEQCKAQYGREPLDQVAFFRDILLEAKADAVVCSPLELEVVRNTGLVCITPGVRPIWAAANDQKRIKTPTEAIHAEADLLVIGRPITNPPASSGLKGPEEAARAIIKEIETALATR